MSTLISQLILASLFLASPIFARNENSFTPRSFESRAPYLQSLKLDNDIIEILEVMRWSAILSFNCAADCKANDQAFEAYMKRLLPTAGQKIADQIDGFTMANWHFAPNNAQMAGDRVKVFLFSNNSIGLLANAIVVRFNQDLAEATVASIVEPLGFKILGSNEWDDRGFVIARTERLPGDEIDDANALQQYNNVRYAVPEFIFVGRQNGGFSAGN